MNQDNGTQNKPTRKRSLAWIYYSVIAVVATCFGFATDIRALLLAVIAAAYAVYLYRGGRFVLWIW
ncbi:hypothetical protein [Kutzneria sp. 744]|uniref:hypothetical protein n=1 Tax=Kutzneria sp. (strain 744) TaxID=345341 RepID=UPI0004BAFD5C|nr:hypothetical protein [Kutzneria sp. 744]